MRKDIGVSVVTKDVFLEKRNKYTLCQFDWVSPSGMLDRYIYGEVTIPAFVPENTLRSNGVYTIMPYTPKHKEFMVRFKRMIGSTSYTFLQNPVDGSDWFVVKTGKYGSSMQNAFASEMIVISEEALYFRINNDIIEAYNGDNIDFKIVNANNQNGNMLLACSPTNNYRYPLTGVGLIRWNNSNIEYTNLTEVLQREFQNDGVNVFNAKYDFDSKDLHLELDTSNVDREE